MKRDDWWTSRLKMLEELNPTASFVVDHHRKMQGSYYGITVIRGDIVIEEMNLPTWMYYKPYSPDDYPADRYEYFIFEADNSFYFIISRYPKPLLSYLYLKYIKPN